MLFQPDARHEYNSGAPVELGARFNVNFDFSESLSLMVQTVKSATLCPSKYFTCLESVEERRTIRTTFEAWAHHGVSISSSGCLAGSLTVSQSGLVQTERSYATLMGSVNPLLYVASPAISPVNYMAGPHCCLFIKYEYSAQTKRLDLIW